MVAAHQEEVDELTKANEELEMLAKTYDDQRLALRNEIARLKKEKGELMKQRPEKYLKFKKTVSKVCSIM